MRNQREAGKCSREDLVLHSIYGINVVTALLSDFFMLVFAPATMTAAEMSQLSRQGSPELTFRRSESRSDTSRFRQLDAVDLHVNGSLTQPTDLSYSPVAAMGLELLFNHCTVGIRASEPGLLVTSCGTSTEIH